MKHSIGVKDKWKLRKFDFGIPELLNRTTLFCTECGKNKYTNRSLIEGIIDSMKKSGIELFYYKCPISDGFHLTSKKQRAPK